MIDLRPFIVLSIVLLGSSYSARVQRAASELNDAFKGRDVNKTIARVEAILARNPNLPRLTRGEILALFENITKADAAKKKQLEPTTEKTPRDHEESLMVVLPFNANSEQNKELEDLYTRQPVTRIVGYSSTTPTVPTTTSNSTERPKRKKKRKNNTRRKPINQEIRPVYVDTTQTSTASPSLGDDLQWNPIVNGARPSVKKQNVNNADIDVPDYMKDTLDSFQNSNNQVYVTLPSHKHSPPTTTTTSSPPQSSSPLPNISIAAQSLTPELKNLLVSLGLLNPDGTQVSSSVVTTTTTHAPPPLIQYISINPTVDPASYVVFKPLPLANSRGKNRGNNEEMLSDDMRHFLASFGLTGDTEQFRSQKSFETGNRIRKSSTTTTTTTTTMSPTNKPNTSTSTSNDDSANMQNDDAEFPMMINTAILTDDMKDVLENIGIVKKSRGKSKGVIFNPAMRTAGLLNKSEEKEKVDKLLSTIRELSAAEKNKSLSAEEVAEQLKNITSSLVDETKEENSFEQELVEVESSEMNYEGYEPAEEELLKLQNGFVDEELKDDTPEGASETDNNENGNNELSDSSSSSSSPRRPSLKDSPNPPDPLSVEELHHFVESNKNEVKRQEPKKTTSSDEISTTTESASNLESSSDENKSGSDTSDSTGTGSSSDSSSDSSAAADGGSEDSTPSQDDLIDSFGGDNPPENRPNGLYFLVDWNTFLRVGTDNKTVDLNFSPKVGDPKNFLPVTVP